MLEEKEKTFLNKGELKCEFVEHNFEKVMIFWLRKKLGKTDPSEPIPYLLFATPTHIEDGWYWFEWEGYRFTHCYVEVLGWTDNTICEIKTYHVEKYEKSEK